MVAVDLTWMLRVQLTFVALNTLVQGARWGFTAIPL
jgi:hypothetical protein